LAEEEEKKVDEEQPADSGKKEEPKKLEEEPEEEKEEEQPPAPPSEAPTVEDIEDVLKEVLKEETVEKEVETLEAEAPPALEVEKEIVSPKPDLSLPEDKPDEKEEIAAKSEEKMKGEEGSIETPVEEPKVMDEPKVPQEEKVEEAPAAEEPIKTEVQEPKAEVPKQVEEPKPKEEPEPLKEKEVKKKKTEEPEAPLEKKEKTKVEKKAKPPKEKKAKGEKPKRAGKAEKKETPEKQAEPEKSTPRKAKKPPVESPSMIISPLLFGKFDLRDVEVTDPGLRKYINLSPVGIPHTGARHANRWLGKTKINIVERLINNLMRTEHSTGKKSFSYRAVNNAFDIILKRTKQNPIQVLVDALQNASPKEEITRLRFGGISVPKAVDTSSSRRLDIALRNICKGAQSSSHRNKKRMEMCLAEEIILASKGDMNSFAISKKEETERIAHSAR
jgi:small subunit ribosomal protein S7